MCRQAGENMQKYSFVCVCIGLWTCSTPFDISLAHKTEATLCGCLAELLADCECLSGGAGMGRISVRDL